MYGWINSCMEALILEKFGQAAWLEVKKEAHLTDDAHWFKHEAYDDEETIILLAAAAKVLKSNVPAVLKLFGAYFVSFVREGGYENLLLSLGRSLREWLSNVNMLHAHLHNALPKMISPRFWLVEEDSGTFQLFYKSERGSGFFLKLVEGIVETVARDYFHSSVDMQLLTVQGENAQVFTSWRVIEVLSADASSGCGGDKDGNSAGSDKQRRSESITNQLKKSQTHHVQFSTDDAKISMRCPFSGVMYSAADVNCSSATAEPEFAHSKSENTLKRCPFSSAANHIATTASGQIGSTSASTSSPTSANATATASVVPPTAANCNAAGNGLMLSPEQLCALFPFHIIIRGTVIEQVGPRLQELCNKPLAGQKISAVCDVLVCSNALQETWDAVLAATVCRVRSTDVHDHGIVSLELRVQLKKHICLQRHSTPLVLLGALTVTPDSGGGPNAPFQFDRSTQTMNFLCQPAVSSLDQMLSTGISMEDLPKAGTSAKMVLLNEHVTCEQNHALRTERMSLQLEKEQRRTLEVKRSFVRYTSHEVRTPLMVAQMSLPVILRSRCLLQPTTATDDDKDAIIDAVNDCTHSLDTAVQILNDLLDYEKLESGIFELHGQSFYPAVDCVQQVVDMFSSSADSKHIAIRQVDLCGGAAGALAGAAAVAAAAVAAVVAAGVSFSPTAAGGKMKAQLQAALADATASNTKLRAKRGSQCGSSNSPHIESNSPAQQRNFDSRLQIFADLKKINQVIRNFMSNALKFTPEGGLVVVSLSTSLTIPDAFRSSIQQQQSQSNRFRRAGSSGGGRLSIAEHSALAADGDGHESAAVGAEEGEVVIVRPAPGGPAGVKAPLEYVRNGYFIVEFKDSGVGISLENQKRIFNEIVQFNPNELQGGGGSGLGLFIAKEIVRLHGGEVAVASNGVGQGTSFFLCLPAYRQRPPRAFSNGVGRLLPFSPRDSRSSCYDICSTAASSQKSQERLPSKLRFLVVDDSALMRKLLNASITSVGYDCEMADDGDSAIELVRKSMHHSAAEANNNGGNQTNQDSSPVFSCKSSSDDPVHRRGSIDSTVTALALDGIGESDDNDAAAAVEWRKSRIEKFADLLPKSVCDCYSDCSTTQEQQPFYDVILMDFVMHRCNGPEAVRAIREMGFWGPILGVTGNSTKADEDQFLDAGVDAVLVKPVPIAAILSCLATFYKPLPQQQQQQ